MKVLHLTTHLNTGGITVYIYQLIKPLLARGIETHVLSAGGDYEQRYRDAGAHIDYLNIRTKSELSPKVYFSIWRVCKYIKDNKIDVIHAHSRVTQVLAFWVQKITKIPVVTTTHGFYKKRLGRTLNPAWGDVTIVISRMVGEALIKDHKIDQKKIRVIHNALNIESLDKAYGKHNRLTVRQKYNVSESAKVVGIVARLVDDKGHEILMEALSELKVKNQNDLYLLIVGEGPHRKNIEAKAAQLGFLNNTVFTGTVKDVTEPLAAADVTVLPVTWREGFGLSLIEAMACHKPVILSDRVGLANIIESAQAGYVVKHKDKEALANALNRALYEDENVHKMTSRARALVEELFSVDRMAREIAAAYSDLFQKR